MCSMFLWLCLNCVSPLSWCLWKRCDQACGGETHHPPNQKTARDPKVQTPYDVFLLWCQIPPQIFPLSVATEQGWMVWEHGKCIANHSAHNGCAGCVDYVERWVQLSHMCQRKMSGGWEQRPLLVALAEIETASMRLCAAICKRRWLYCWRAEVCQ